MRFLLWKRVWLRKFIIKSLSFLDNISIVAVTLKITSDVWLTSSSCAESDSVIHANAVAVSLIVSLWMTVVSGTVYDWVLFCCVVVCSVEDAVTFETVDSASVVVVVESTTVDVMGTVAVVVIAASVVIVVVADVVDGIVVEVDGSSVLVSLSTTDVSTRNCTGGTLVVWDQSHWNGSKPSLDR